MTTTTNAPSYLDDVVPELVPILANPASDVERLILADFLEERGEVERAEFIRVQVELATNPECNTVGMHCDSCEKLKRTERYWCETNRLSLQEKLLHFDVGLWRQKEYAVYHPAALFRRGFISEVHAPLAVLQQHLPALVRQHPIERVRATDKEPENRLSEGCLVWWIADRDFTRHFGLPYKLWERVEMDPNNAFPAAKDFPTAEAAHDALSRALLGLART